MSPHVGDTVGLGQVLKTKARRPILALRPFDTLRTQGMKGTHHIDQVPARITVLPLPRIGIKQVAIEQHTADFIIETQRVVTQRTGTRLAHQRMNAPGELGFG